MGCTVPGVPSRACVLTCGGTACSLSLAQGICSLTPCFSCSSASAAFLLSLYIKDVWLGAQRPDALFTHVQMVRDAAGDALGGDQEAIVSLCEDIAASAPDL